LEDGKKEQSLVACGPLRVLRELLLAALLPQIHSCDPYESVNTISVRSSFEIFSLTPQPRLSYTTPKPLPRYFHDSYTLASEHSKVIQTSHCIVHWALPHDHHHDHAKSSAVLKAVIGLPDLLRGCGIHFKFF
jgi:hypothetical protein